LLLWLAGLFEYAESGGTNLLCGAITPNGTVRYLRSYEYDAISWSF
jgi:hypothetical protein